MMNKFYRVICFLIKLRNFSRNNEWKKDKYYIEFGTKVMSLLYSDNFTIRYDVKSCNHIIFVIEKIVIDGTR